MAKLDSLLDLFQTINTTKKELVESLYVDEACYNEHIDGKLNKEKFECVYPYSGLEGDENDKSTIIFKDLIKDTDLYNGLNGNEEFDYEFGVKDANVDDLDLSNNTALKLAKWAKTNRKKGFSLNNFRIIPFNVGSFFDF